MGLMFGLVGYALIILLVCFVIESHHRYKSQAEGQIATSGWLIQLQADFNDASDFISGSLVVIGFIMMAASPFVAIYLMAQSYLEMYPGMHCTISQDNGYGAVDQKAKEQLEKALGAKDSIGVGILLASQNAIRLEKGTECLILESTIEFLNFSYARKVRILSGPFRGEAAWVPNEILSSSESKQKTVKTRENVPRPTRMFVPPSKENNFEAPVGRGSGWSVVEVK